MSAFESDALRYHAEGRPGKIEVVPTKPVATQRDLTLAYSPGVAEPCMAIHRDPEEAFRYTARGNLVAVVSNGTAVLGLGNIGAMAAKPVMEGKGVLFKKFAGIDVFDIEIDTEDPQEVIRFCQLLEPTVGGINLEDIRAPECFLIEQTLRETMRVPVFHDDQHGHRDHRGRGPCERAGDHGPGHRRCPCGLRGRRGVRGGHRPPLPAPRGEVRESDDGGSDRRDLQGARDGDE